MSSFSVCVINFYITYSIVSHRVLHVLACAYVESWYRFILFHFRISHLHSSMIYCNGIFEAICVWHINDSDEE